MRSRKSSFFRRYSFIVCVCTVVLVFISYASTFWTMHRGKSRLRSNSRHRVSLLRAKHTDQTAKNSRTGATTVLILTYMRSGSSLLGNILQQATNAFYLFEPLHRLRTAKENETVITYINGSNSSLPLDINKEKNDAIYNWFTCDIQKISVRSFNDRFMSPNSKKVQTTIKRRAEKTRQTLSCLSTYTNLRKPDRDKKCAEELEEGCLKSSIRIIKTIRTELKSAGRLLKDLSNMKIIHLVRDPRATMKSKSYFNECWKIGIKRCTQEYCQRFQNDVTAMDRLLKNYTHRIRTFFYEDLALYPVETSRQIFNFVNEPFTDKVREYVISVTSAAAENDDNRKLGTTKSNSSEHVFTWKTNMNLTFRNNVQEQCDFVFERYKDRYKKI